MLKVKRRCRLKSFEEFFFCLFTTRLLNYVDRNHQHSCINALITDILTVFFRYVVVVCCACTCLMLSFDNHFSLLVRLSFLHLIGYNLRRLSISIGHVLSHWTIELWFIEQIVRKFLLLFINNQHWDIEKNVMIKFFSSDFQSKADV